MKDYYKVLDVGPEASDSEIKSAFRTIAKQSHPDCGLAGCVETFRGAREAYEVLSDPLKRREYDRLRRQSYFQRSRNVEYRERTNGFTDPRPSTRWPYRSSLFDLMDVFDHFFFGASSRRSYPDDYDTIRDPHYDLEVQLTKDEVHYGVSLPLTLQYQHVCPRCGGEGYDYFSTCSACLGSGLVMIKRIIHLNIPPGIRDASVLEYTFSSFNDDKQRLRVLFTIVDK